MSRSVRLLSFKFFYHLVFLESVYNVFFVKRLNSFSFEQSSLVTVLVEEHLGTPFYTFFWEEVTVGNLWPDEDNYYTFTIPLSCTTHGVDSSLTDVLLFPFLLMKSVLPEIFPTLERVSLRRTPITWIRRDSTLFSVGHSHSLGVGVSCCL